MEYDLRFWSSRWGHMAPAFHVYELSEIGSQDHPSRLLQACQILHGLSFTTQMIHTPTNQFSGICF